MSSNTSDAVEVLPATKENKKPFDLLQYGTDLAVMRKGVGRPTTYNAEDAARFLEGIERGLSWRKVCEEIGVVPSVIYRWLEKQPEFEKQWQRARKNAAHSYVGDVLSILDDRSHDIIESSPGRFLSNPAAVHRDKSRAEARLKIAGLFNEQYKESKNQTQVNVQINNAIDAPRQETRDEWLARQRANDITVERSETVVPISGAAAPDGKGP